MSRLNLFQDRSRVILFSFGLIIAILIIKLVHIQLLDSSFKVRANATAISKRTVYPSRGLIYDRNHQLMVYNEPVYDVYLTYNLLDPAMDIAKFCDLLELTMDDYDKMMDIDWSKAKHSKNIPVRILKKVPAKIISRFQEHLHEFPGIQLHINSMRAYPNSGSGHILGYVNEISQKQLERAKGQYQQGDLIGVVGIEKTYEHILKGKKGVQYVLKDNRGRIVGNYKLGNFNQNASSGLDLVLSIDLKLQEFGERLMKGRKGAVVAIDPGTGDILSLISSPAYDPESLAMHKNRAQVYQRLSQDSLRPFFNRAISAKYPPGSIFKPILALIGLQEKIISKDKYIRCDGAYHYKNYNWGCHAGPSLSNVVHAIQISCNTYFYQTYRELIDMYGFNKPSYGLNKVWKHLDAFGIGRRLGIDLPAENSGNNPDSKYYDELYKTEEGRWRSTYLISNGIGQGEIELTTLQMANLAAIIANRGYYITPHLLKKINHPDSSQIQYDISRTKIDPENFELVIEGMQRAITHGTGGMAKVPGVTVVGKTGTSENKGKDHSVFFAFAPRENPKIAIAVYIEHGGWGGSVAAPIAGLMIEKYINDDIAPSRQWLLDRMSVLP